MIEEAEGVKKWMKKKEMRLETALIQELQ